MILNQTAAAKALGVTRQTVRNYEKQGLLRRVKGRPGAWYQSADVFRLAGKPQTVRSEVEA